MELEDGYPAEVREYERIIRHEPDRAKALFPSPDSMAEHLRPDSAHNHLLFDVLDLDAGHYLRISSTQLMAALTRKANRQRIEANKQRDEQRRRERAAERVARDERRDEVKQARSKAEAATKAKAKEELAQIKTARARERQQEMEEILTAAIGGYPMNEREFVRMKLAHDGITMSFDRVFRNRAGQIIKAEQVLLDLHLTAADLALVKPRGDYLAASNLDRALSEWCLVQRELALTEVIQRVERLPENWPLSREQIYDELERICGYYFKGNAQFYACALRAILWQIKRMMRGLSVEQRRMLVFLGPQNSGKSFLQRLIMSAIKELVGEASLKDVLDERQLDLPTYAVILLDELVAADRADAAALKNFITGVEWSRRPMRTNVTEKIRVRASLLGTSNHSLGKLIFDSSGMRRFIEAEVRSRVEIEPYWPLIVAFDWLALWQAIDIDAPDPLEAYADVLRDKQEELRNPENTEVWMTQFDPEHSHNIKERTSAYVDYHASDLYEVFRQWEENFDRGWRGTSLSRWGRDMKSLIDQGHVVDWSYYKSSTKVIYRRHRRQDEQTRTTDTLVSLRDHIDRRGL